MTKQYMQEILTQPPREKEFLNSGLVVMRENIVADTTNVKYTVYTWLETRYNQLEYIQVIEQEKDILKVRVDTQQETINQQQVVMDELLFEIIPSLTEGEVI